MGFFDTITIDSPVASALAELLPDAAEIVFQTKAFDCTMSRYRITSDGELLSENIVDYTDLSDSQALESIRSSFGCVTRLSAGWRATRITRRVVFYCVIGNPLVWVQVTARFYDGRLIEVDDVVREPFV